MKSLKDIYFDLVKEHHSQWSSDTLISESALTESTDVDVFCDKGTYHTYIDFYARQLSRFRNKVTMLEIGIMTGGSLLLWSKFFKEYDLTAIEYSPSFYGMGRLFHPELMNNPNIDLYFSTDSTDPTFASGFDNELFDVIIDDGSHDPDMQLSTFRNYFLKTKVGGTYYIEDVRGEPEVYFLETEIVAWLKARHINAGVYVYRGDTVRRVDDIIIFIERV